MGKRLVSEVLDFSRTRGRARLVLIAFAERAKDQTRIGYPGTEDLGRRAGGSEDPIHRRDVHKLLKVIEGLGELVVLSRGGGRGNPTVRQLVELDPEQVAAARQQLQLDAGNSGTMPPFSRWETAAQTAAFEAVNRGIMPQEPLEPGNQHPLGPPQGGQVEELDSLWGEIRAALKAAVPDYTFAIWLEELRLVAREDSTLYVTAPPHTYSWVVERYAPLITGAACQVLGEDVDLQLQKAQPLIDAAARKQGRDRAPGRRRGRSRT